jgi:UDP-N-acetylmuramoyl-tripeptide--D-alanyl-D-alanine ligase
MHELGESTAIAHKKIGTLAQEIGVDHLVAINQPDYGASTGTMRVHHVENIEEAALLMEHFSAGDVVLAKASRSEGLEVLAQKIESDWLDKSGVEK